MDRLTLVGFVGEIDGNEGRLTAYEPVLEHDNRRLVANHRQWDEDSLVELVDADFEFVHFLARADRLEILPGQVVWAAGSQFRSTVAGFPALQELELDMRAWRGFGRGVRWKVGTYRELDQLRDRNARLLEQQLHSCLFDPMEKSFEESERTFQLYLALEGKESLRRFQNMALFYFEARREADYRITSARAIAAGAISSEQAFEAAVAQLRNWLEERRLSDGAKTRSDRPSTINYFKPPSLFVSYEKLLTFDLDAAYSSRRELLL